MAASNDGGPAFPLNEKHAEGTHYHSHEGMTLRDWFAGQVRVPDDLGLMLIEELAGRKHPAPQGWNPEQAIEIAKFWADGEAAYRYLHADAMIAARSKSEAA